MAEAQPPQTSQAAAADGSNGLPAGESGKLNASSNAPTSDKSLTDTQKPHFESLRRQAEDKGHYRDRMLNTTGQAAARAGFLAGFSYYEFSRVSNSKTMVPIFDSVQGSVYPILLYVAFTLAVISSAVSVLCSMYTQQVHTDDADALAKALNPPTVLGGPARRGHQGFVYGMLFYALAMSFMSDYFWPQQQHDADPVGAGIRWAARLGLWIFAALVWIVNQMLMVQTGQYEKNMHSRAPDEDRDALAYRLDTVDGMGGRALFMMGFLGHALARWQGNNSDPTYALVNCLYQLLVSWAVALMATSVFSASTYIAYVKHIAPAYRNGFATQVSWLYNLCRISFFGGCSLTLVSSAVMGWGCSLDCGVIEDGSCYAQVAWLPAVCMGAAQIFVIFCFMQARLAQMKAVKQAVPVDEGEADSATRSLQSVLDMSSSATLAGGFVLYNIATYDTDVLRAPLLDGSVNFGLTGYSWAFLVANWLSFALGTAVTLSNLSVELHFRGLSPDAKVRYVEEIKPTTKVLMWLFLMSMITFVAAFALFGLCKMSVHRVEPAVIGACGIALGYLGYAYVHDKFDHVLHHAPASAGRTSRRSRRSKLHPNGVTVILEEYAHENAVMQVGAYAEHIGIAGGFAYNAVSFVFRPLATFTPIYMTLMSVCFLSSIGVSLFQTLIGSLLSRLDGAEQKDRFINSIQQPLQANYWLSVLARLSFLLAFCVMGWIKQWSYTDEDQSVASDMFGWLQCVTSVATFLAVVYVKRDLDHVVRSTDNSNRDAHAHYNWKEMMRAVQIRAGAASFQMGNVFYEILFSATALDGTVLYTWCYFSLAMVTFGLGLANVFIASLLSYQMYQLPPEQRGSLGYRTRNIQQVLTMTYAASLVTWLIHFGFSAAMKVPDLALWSACLAAGGVLSVFYLWARVASTASGFRPFDETSTASPDGPESHGLLDTHHEEPETIGVQQSQHVPDQRFDSALGRLDSTGDRLETLTKELEKLCVKLQLPSNV